MKHMFKEHCPVVVSMNIKHKEYVSSQAVWSMRDNSVIEIYGQREITHFRILENFIY